MIVRGQDGSVVLAEGGARDDYQFLAPTLASMRKKGEVIELAYLSHYSAEYAGGVEQLIENAIAWRIYDSHISKLGRVSNYRRRPTVPRPAEVRAIWYNPPTEQLGDLDAESEERLLSWLLPLSLDKTRPGLAPRLERFMRELRSSADFAYHLQAMGIPMNCGSDGMLKYARETPVLVGGLKVYVLGPSEDDLMDVRTRWQNQLAQSRQLGEVVAQRAALAWVDPTHSEADRLWRIMLSIADDIGSRGLAEPPQMPALTLMIHEGNRDLMLGGSANARQLLNGLATVGALDENGRKHFSALRVNPENLADGDFLARVTSDYYLISCHHRAPDLEALTTLIDARQRVSERPFCLLFNSSSQVSQGDERRHMKRVEAWVKRGIKSSNGQLRARFLTKGTKLDARI